jgi:hypothetical protein
VGEGQALLRVDSFGLTANNITYAVFGDAMSYWDFFPAPEGWGRIPAWGFATVAESKADGVEEGARVYGYVPMSDHLLIEPSGVDARVVFDNSAHRSHLPTPYNRFTWTATDPTYDAGHEDAQILLWPLFYTSFLLDDYLGDNGLFGGGTVIVSSASSKTAIGTAFQLAERNGNGLIGLTSAGNRDFVEGLGIYKEVVTYDEIPEIDATASIYVDISGSAKVRKAIHECLGDELLHSCAVGVSDWQGFGEDVGELPGPAPKFFFAPDQVAKRSREWGMDGLEARFAEAWGRFVPWAESWLKVEHGSGFEAIEKAYRKVLSGEVPPDTAHVLSPR